MSNRTPRGSRVLVSGMTASEPPLGPDVRLALMTTTDTLSEIMSGIREVEAS